MGHKIADIVFGLGVAGLIYAVFILTLDDKGLVLTLDKTQTAPVVVSAETKKTEDVSDDKKEIVEKQQEPAVNDVPNAELPVAEELPAQDGQKISEPVVAKPEGVTVVSFDGEQQNLLHFNMKGPDCKALLEYVQETRNRAEYEAGVSITGKPVVPADYVAGESVTGKKVVSAELQGNHFVVTERLQEEMDDFTFPVNLVLQKTYPYLQSEIESGEIPLVSVRVKDGVVWLNGLPTSPTDKQTLTEACLAERKRAANEEKMAHDAGAINDSSIP